jgi:O-methyltransferase
MRRLVFRGRLRASEVQNERDPCGSGGNLLLEHSSPEDRAIVERALPHSIVGVPRLLAVVDAVRYCVSRGIEGALAECGVWRGGAVLAMVLTLQDMGERSRDVYLYDTFEGMTAPTEADVSDLDPPALETWRAAVSDERRAWAELFDPAVFNEDSVRRLLLDTGYPPDRLHFVRGPVEQTLPSQAPSQLALVRLDTDWYESTRHELEHLFPRLQIGGVLIIDDYGHWAGARRAVDEYFASTHPPLLLSRIDYTGRLAVKA